MNDSLNTIALLIAMLGGGSVIGIALKLAYDGSKNAGKTHDTAFDKGFMSRNAEIDGLRRSFEARMREVETELGQLRSALVRMIGWVRDEHKEEAFELLLKLGMPTNDTDVDE